MSSNSAVNAALPAVQTAANASGSDFKCIIVHYMGGGNDQSNTVVPRSGQAYTDYQNARPTLAHDASTLLPITPGGGWAGPELGLHPVMTGIRDLFAAGKCAILANVGMLSVPTTATNVNKPYGVSADVQLPINLYSHSDQANAMASLTPNDQTNPTGWLGRIMDLCKPTYDSTATVSPVISAAGNTPFTPGYDVVQYQVGANGAAVPGISYQNADLSWMEPDKESALEAASAITSVHVLKQAVSDITVRAFNAMNTVNAALATVGQPATTFPNGQGGTQAKVVARMIKAHTILGHRRVVFYLSYGGWDFHSNMLADQATRLTELDAVIKALNDEMVVLGLDSQVTQITMADFGRTLQSNGDGTDHGWGSHHFIVGGAVDGGKIKGTWPQVKLGGIEDVGRGNLCPSTSIDTYLYSVHKWFGIPDSAIPVTIPMIARFPTNLALFK